jgi:hypothetical protein
MGSAVTTAATTAPFVPAISGEDEEEEEEEEEEAVDEAFMPPPSTVPAATTQSRAGRKRAPTMKALEAEIAPKRKRRQAREGKVGREAEGEAEEEVKA